MLPLQPVPERKPFSRADYDKRPETKAAKRKYRHDNSKYITDAQYLSKKIVAVDGEGINLPDGSHISVMLAISDAKPLVDPNGLTTKKMLDYLWSHLSTQDLNVIYGGSYDFNMILRGKGKDGVTAEQLAAIYNGNFLGKGTQVYGYRIKWMKGKQLTIIRDGRTVIINDVISFFQCSFIQACDQYLIEYEGRDELVREKAKRGNFDVAEIKSISHYNQLELRLLVRLVSELRARANQVHLRPRRWYSPGAIAASLFTREKVKEHLGDVPPHPASAARFAYAGGRFELVKYGAVKDTVYEYDINSAYPAALTKVPSLAHGNWIHSSGDIGDEPFALYRVTFHGTESHIPGPLFCRGEPGTVTYPLNVTNWIWAPEMEVLRQYCEQIPNATYVVHEVWNFKPHYGIPKPFAFVNKLYAESQNLKAQGDGAQLVVKLALNSLYGKTAQQVGWVAAKGDKPLRIPPFHKLEWAGYITSWTRSRVLQAALQAPESIIAFETDALFSTVKLDLPIGKGLGAWEVTEFSSLTYVQSGHYYGTLADGTEVVKCRGVDKGFISREAVEKALQNPVEKRVLNASLTRFYGAGIALARGLDKYWCRWLTEPKQLQLMPTGKRIHLPCVECDDSDFRMGVWHETICPVVGGVSKEYPVEWINPDPKMTELDEKRRSEHDYDVD